MTKMIRAMVVDDSAFVRKLLSEILSSDPGIEVVATAYDPFDAREKIKKFKPDVLTLDIEMPKMDGITFLRNLMRLRPMPVVMVSTLTEAGADVTLEALALGAIDFVSKPKIDLECTMENYAEELITKTKSAAGARAEKLTARAASPQQEGNEKLSADAVLQKSTGHKRLATTESIIAIGASTGGTEAIKEVLMRMPVTSPGIVVAQHIPAAFSASFAQRMDSVSEITVCQATDGQQILPGHAYIAPGDRHLLVVRNGARYHCKLSDGPAVNRHKPSVDVLFRSTAQSVGHNAIGVILTGMGDDGAAGLKEMQDSGAPTMAQDERTSVVWGMPGAAVKLVAADKVLPLQHIAEHALSKA